MYIILFSLAFIGCNSQPKEGLSKQKKILRINSSHKPLTLDPRKTGDFVSSSIQFMLCEGLTRMNEKSTKDIAMSDVINISNDQLTYTFHIRNALWSDGSPVTAFDFERTFKETLSPDFPAPSVQLFYSIKGAEKAKKGEISPDEICVSAINSHTLQITLERPTPFFLEITSFCCLFPVHTKGINKDDYIGNGPFRIKSYLSDSSIILEKNPYYWDQENVKLDEIHISFVPSDSTSFYMFENNELDLFGLGFGVIPSDAMQNLREKNAIKSISVGATSLLQFHTSLFPFQNKNLRKAIANAINRKDIVEHIIQSDSEIAYSIIPSILRGNNQSRHYLDGDLDLAKLYLSLALEEMNCSLDEINPISYLYLKSERNERVVQAIASQLLEIGLKIKPQAVEFNVLLDKLRKRNFQMSQSAWLVQYNDPMNILERFESKLQPNNDPDWENAEYKSLLNRSFFAKDQDKRNAMIAAAENIFMDELPQIPLYHWNLSYLVKPWVKGIYISPIGSIHFTNVDIINNTDSTD